MPGSTVIMMGQLRSNGTGHMEKLTGFECNFQSGGFRCLGKQQQNLGWQKLLPGPHVQMHSEDVVYPY